MQSFLAAAGLVGSVALVGVTIWYAWQTQQMVREMRAGRQSAIRPQLRLDIHLIGATVLMKIENVGVGPALNCSCALRASSSADGTEQEARWSTPILRAGESRLMHFPLDAKQSALSFGQAKDDAFVVQLDGTCADMDGLAHTVSDVIRFADRGPEVSVSSSTDKWPRHIETIATEVGKLRRSVESLRSKG